MDEMQRLIRANNLKADQVESVRVGANKPTWSPSALFHHRPVTGLEAKFSMEYCMAVLLVDGKAGLSQFTDAAVNRPELQAMLRRVTFVNDPAADAAGADKMRSFIEIHCKDGRVITGMADYAKGSPQFPMSFDDVVEKFRDCAQYGGLPDAAATKVIEQVKALDQLDDIRKLTSLMQRPA